jgi:hypothetical protein
MHGKHASLSCAEAQMVPNAAAVAASAAAAYKLNSLHYK